jgi:3-oxoacyl-[acyl-carrier protein] reductase
MGSALVKALADAGADVAVHYHQSREGAVKTAKAVERRGRRCLIVRADVTREAQVNSMFDAVEKRLGRVDILVNNVGNFLLKPLSKVKPPEWHGILASNLHSAFYCCRRALPGMRRRGFGRIVNMGFGPCEQSVSRERTTVYHMAKTALLVYTKGLAQEEAPHGITVNMVSPGSLFSSLNLPPVESIPAKRYARYSDMTNAILFLLAEESSYITGTNILVTGGRLT